MAGKFMKWQEVYNLGIPEIDAQHLSVFNLIDDLNDAFVNRETESKMKYLLNELEQYATNHFATEEDYFRSAKYSDMSEHIIGHQNYKEKIQEFRKKHESGSNITYSLMSFLRTWWMEHILKEDKAYADIIQAYIKRQKVSFE
jgi:hemerythrin